MLEFRCVRSSLLGEIYQRLGPLEITVEVRSDLRDEIDWIVATDPLTIDVNGDPSALWTRESW